MTLKRVFINWLRFEKGFGVQKFLLTGLHILNDKLVGILELAAKDNTFGRIHGIRHFHLLFELQELSSEIDSAGCHIKDLEGGLIDFPTIWEGREVYLCWKLGESEVGFWHEVDAGYAGRQPLKNAPESGC